MLGDISMHRMDKGDVVDTLRDLRKNVADPLATLTVLFESKRRGHEAHFGITQRFPIDRFWDVPPACFASNGL